MNLSGGEILVRDIRPGQYRNGVGDTFTVLSVTHVTSTTAHITWKYDYTRNAEDIRSGDYPLTDVWTAERCPPKDLIIQEAHTFIQ